MVKLTFEETLEILMSRHRANFGGNAEWVDWDAIYSELLDEGYESSEASVLLDEYMEKNGY